MGNDNKVETSEEIEKPLVNTSSEIHIKKEISKIKQARANRKFRIALIVILMIIIGLLFIFWGKAKIALAVIFLILLAALGMETTQNDFDLGELLETKSFSESKMSRDDYGNILFDSEGNITTDSTKGKKADDYDCKDFPNQPNAQNFYLKVGGLGNDLNRLDGDKDGKACEVLPKN